MKLHIRRITETPDATLSMLSIDGRDVCFVLEDGARAVKVPGQTRIPAGEYQIGLRKDTPMANKYDIRFKHIWHAGMLHIRDIPGFEHVYIHVGNTVEDTAGCPLVGTGAVLGDGYLRVTGSAVAYMQVYSTILAALQNRDRVTLTVTR